MRTGRIRVIVWFALCAFAWSLAALAQQPARVARVAILSDESPSLGATTFQPFVQGLQDLGWVEGQNIAFEHRYAEGKNETLPDFAAELVRVQPDVILAIGTRAARAAETATPAIPIVFARVSDPVGLGLVPSLARPGGNLTGVSVETRDLAAKWVELLVSAIPDIKRVGILWEPSFPPSASLLKEIEGAARSLNLQLVPAEVRGPDDLEPARRAVVGQGAAAVIVLPSPVFAGHLQRVAELTANARIPAMFYRREFVEAGGLMSYGANFSDMYRRAAGYVDKILKGAKPADIPVEQPTRFELVINLKTANELGLTMPLTLLGRADEVLE